MRRRDSTASNRSPWLPHSRWVETIGIRKRYVLTVRPTKVSKPGKSLIPPWTGIILTLGIPLLAGRTFQSSDLEKGPEVLVVNHKMAETFWPGKDPVGQRMRVDKTDRLLTVVGVVGDGKYTDLDEPTRPYMYYDLAQHYQSGIALIIRTR